MTLDDYTKARDLVINIEKLKDEIRDLRAIMDNNTSVWLMEVRESSAFSTRKINHCGLLPEFLQAVLSKQLAKLHELENELDKL